MLYNKYDSDGHLILESIDSSDAIWQHLPDLVVIDVENDNLNGEVFVSTSLCNDDGMPLWRLTGYKPNPLDPYYSREAGDVEWGEETDFQVLHHPQLMYPGDDLYRDADEMFEKVITSDLLLEPVETLQDEYDGEMLWDYDYTLTEKDGTEKRVYAPNWFHVRGLQSAMDNLVEKLLERISLLNEASKYFFAKKHIRKLSRAGMLQKKGVRHNEEFIGGEKVRKLLPQGLNFTRYALVYNALLQKGVTEGWEKSPDWKVVKDWSVEETPKKEVTDSLDAPRGGFFLAEQIRDAIDLEKEVLERFSFKHEKWVPSPRVKALLDKGPRLYERISTEEIEAWLAS